MYKHMMEKKYILLYSVYFINNKNKEVLHLLSSQSCLTLICLQVSIAFPIILRRISFLTYTSNDPFTQVALLVSSSIPLFIMLLQLMSRRHNLSFFSLLYSFFSPASLSFFRLYTKRCPFSQ